MKTEKLTAAQFRARHSRKASPAKAPASARAGKAKPGSPGRSLVEVRVEYGPCYAIHWIPEGSRWVEFWQLATPASRKKFPAWPGASSGVGKPPFLQIRQERRIFVLK